jgi:hypothetical protein
METKNRLLVLSLAVSVAVSASFSQKVGSTSMQFFHVMPCARATALGDAYSVWASGAEAVFWNPSGVALVQNQEFSTTYINWIFDAKQAALSYAASLGGYGAAGLQLQYIDYGTFDETVISDQYSQALPYPYMTGRTFHPYAYVAGITYAKSLIPKFSIGGTFKVAHESLYPTSNTVFVYDSSRNIAQTVNTYGNAYLFDFGMRYNTGFHTIGLAAAVQNFGASVKYASDNSPAPLLFRVGVAADLIGQNGLLLEQEDSRLGVAFDLFQPNDYDQQAHMGLEYEFAQTVALRIGYKYNYDSEGLTFGGGIKHTFNRIRIILDYSYSSLGTYLGSAHRISLGVGL